MLKRLIVASFSFAVVGCMPAQGTKIGDASCKNGICPSSPVQTKPTLCSGTTSVKSFVGQKFRSVETAVESTRYWTEVYFGNQMVDYTQFCSKEGLILNAGFGFDYMYSSDTKEIRYLESKLDSSQQGGLNCKAEVSPELFSYAFEGSCLVLTTKSGEKVYYVRKN